ncbi:MAG: PP2C family serine/threonine-protein phosphatase [Gammaproteobacteria bacterium]
MHIETAITSLVGHREENQDAVGIERREGAVFAVVVDGLGGHAEGAIAAQHALGASLDAFAKAELPIENPSRFLEQTAAQAHMAVSRLGAHLPVELMPRATYAACLVQGNYANWLHIGDSRVYHLRESSVQERTRDHSHVEMLLQTGLIAEHDIAAHPLRNFVESCLGGRTAPPLMDVATDRHLRPNDVLLVCSDGLWSPLDESTITEAFSDQDGTLPENLKALCENAVAAAAPNSDNTTAAAIRRVSPDKD